MRASPHTPRGVYCGLISHRMNLNFVSLSLRATFILLGESMGANDGAGGCGGDGWAKARCRLEMEAWGKYYKIFRLAWG